MIASGSKPQVLEWQRPLGRLAVRGMRVALVIAVVTALWQVTCGVLHVPGFIVPTPGAIVEKMIARWPLYLDHTLWTLEETTLGFSIALVAGVAVAAFIVAFPLVRELAMPLLLLAQVVPKAAVAPIFLIWFGYGLLPKVLIAVLVSFFPIVVNVVTGLGSLDGDLARLARSLRTNPWQVFTKFQLPTALPYLFSGMKVAMTLAIIGAVIGEFVGSDHGLGYLIIIANQQLDTPLAFGALSVLSMLGIALYGLVCLAERCILPWEAAQPGVQEGQR